MHQYQGETKFLVRVGMEFGVSGETTILPSELIYPGESMNSDNSQAIDDVVAEMYLCDEGGRFYLNDNHYQVVRVKNDFSIQEDQVWITASTFKSLLKMSNKVSVQLRCMASLILEDLNPEIAANRNYV